MYVSVSVCVCVCWRVGVCVCAGVRKSVYERENGFILSHSSVVLMVQTAGRGSTPHDFKHTTR